jgi:hypothetical protein
MVGPQPELKPMIETTAGWYFSASHRDPVRQELHGHSYEVEVSWPAGEDVTELQKRVKAACAGFDHTTLPDPITRAEDLIWLFRDILDGCIRIKISRPVERLSAEWRA